MKRMEKQNWMEINICRWWNLAIEKNTPPFEYHTKKKIIRHAKCNRNVTLLYVRGAHEGESSLWGIFYVQTYLR